MFVKWLYSAFTAEDAETAEKNLRISACSACSAVKFISLRQSAREEVQLQGQEAMECGLRLQRILALRGEAGLAERGGSHRC